MTERQQGPVEILCKEIGFRFDRHIEAIPIFVGFVAQLVHAVAHMREMQGIIAMHTEAGCPSENSAEALRLAKDMLAGGDSAEMIRLAAAVHDFSHTANPDEGPCDHLIDMLSSCASAIRFGLETPCRSRHAAEAAGHIWRLYYGVTLEDDCTPNWKKDWARVQLQQAITALALKSAKQ